MMPHYAVQFVYGCWTWIRFRHGCTTYGYADSRDEAIYACIEDGADSVEVIDSKKSVEETLTERSKT